MEINTILELFPMQQALLAGIFASVIMYAFNIAGFKAGKAQPLIAGQWWPLLFYFVSTLLFMKVDVWSWTIGNVQFIIIQFFWVMAASIIFHKFVGKRAVNKLIKYMGGDGNEAG